jgi:predicted Rossmann fold nucleotide-binding protein DprA/Smf involved in DNA uptake
MLRLAVVGSRRRLDREHVEAAILAAVGELAPDGAVIIVSGGCRGVDTWAAELARRHGWVLEEHLPDLAGLDAGAPRWRFSQRYHARNLRIAGGCDVMLAFVAPDRRGGTEHAIRCAEALGKRIMVSGPADAALSRGEAEHAGRPTNGVRRGAPPCAHGRDRTAAEKVPT